MRMYDIIKKKRDGQELSAEEIRWFVDGYSKGDIPDYQAAALCMAIYFKDMTIRETTDLTLAVRDSGEKLDFSAVNGIRVDKHSTGGVGDKTSFAVAPIVASLGIKVAKMSGRGLGHTGGTVDKLESIDGFKTTLSEEDFIDGTIDLISVLCKAGLVQTRSEGRRAIEQGGVTFGSDKITDVKAAFGKDAFTGEGVVVKRGKKNFRKVILR